MRKITDNTNSKNDNPTVYPRGYVVDAAGATPGTTVGEPMVGDILQFFNKLAVDAGLTLNSLPDNETNGYQIFTAFVNYIRNVLVATETAKGTVEKATPAEAQAGTANKYLDAALLQLVTATTTRKGIIEKATSAEAQAGTADKYIDAYIFQNISAAWINITFNSGFGQGTPPLQYRKDKGKLELRGQFYNDGGGTATMFTLPVGFRPSYTILIGVRYVDGSTVTSQYFRIDTNGNFNSPSGFSVNQNSILNEILILD